MAFGRERPSNRSRQADTRSSIVPPGTPLTERLSKRASSENSTDIFVHKESSVSDREPAAGRLMPLSRLPQYFTRAIFGCATAWARMFSFQGIIRFRIRVQNYSLPRQRFVAAAKAKLRPYGCSLVRSTALYWKCLRARVLRREDNRLQQTDQRAPGACLAGGLRNASTPARSDALRRVERRQASASVARIRNRGMP